MHTNAFVQNVWRVLEINVSIHVTIDHNYQYTGLSPSVWEFSQECGTFHAASCIGRLDATEPIRSRSRSIALDEEEPSIRATFRGVRSWSISPLIELEYPVGLANCRVSWTSSGTPVPWLLSYLGCRVKSSVLQFEKTKLVRVA
jgi:hypothetical protein